MAKERQEKIYKVGKEELTEHQIPKAFDIVNVFLDFREKAKRVGVEQAVKELEPLLSVQLRTLIMEQAGLPLTEELTYSVSVDQNGSISVHDHRYLQQTDLVELAVEGWIYALGHRTRPEKRVDSDYTTFFTELYAGGVIDPRLVADLEQRLLSQYHEDLLIGDHTRKVNLFIDRYLLEAWQNFLLVHVELAKDPIFAKPLIDLFASPALQREYTGNWIAAILNASEAHPGDKAFSNFYRVRRNSNGEFTVQKRGLYFKQSDKQLAELMKKWGVDDVAPNEGSLLSHFAHLDENWNVESLELLMKVAEMSDQHSIKKKIQKALLRYQKQEAHIAEAVRVVQEVFQDEYAKDDMGQEERLNAVLEVLANVLILNRAVKGEKILDVFAKAVEKGFGRNSFMRDVAWFSPTVIFQVGGLPVKLLWGVSGWSICGALSAGGLGFKVGVNTKVHGFGGGIFGGGKGESCFQKRCGGCGNTHISDSDRFCSVCHWAPGMAKGHQPKNFKPNGTNHKMSAKPPSTSSSKPQITQNFLDSVLAPKRSVDVGKVLDFGPKNSVGIQEGLLHFQKAA